MEDKLEIWNLSLDDQDPMMLNYQSSNLKEVILILI